MLKTAFLITPLLTRVVINNSPEVDELLLLVLEDYEDVAWALDMNLGDNPNNPSDDIPATSFA
jgi:hypothetical protein